MNQSAHITLCDIFIRVLALPSSEEAEEAAYGQTRGWDSVGHMSLVQNIEDEFGLLLGPEDIIDMDSFQRACEVLSRHGIATLS